MGFKCYAKCVFAPNTEVESYGLVPRYGAVRGMLGEGYDYRLLKRGLKSRG